MRLRLAPKLTNRHIFQKPFNNMKVARATQVLSGSVCLALLSLVYAKELPASARSTAYLCDQMDKFFDCLNSCCPKKTEQKLRYAIGKGKSELIEFLEQLPWIAAWKFEGRRQPHTIAGWQIAIKAILLLWEDIPQNFDSAHAATATRPAGKYVWAHPPKAGLKHESQCVSVHLRAEAHWDTQALYSFR